MLAPEEVPANPERRLFLKGAAILLANVGVGTLESCAAIQPSREELAFYERLKSAPKGKRPITDFPDIVAGMSKDLPRILVDANQHKPPIGIDYEVNTSFPWTPIVAPAAGYVLEAGFNSRWGYYIRTNHYGGHDVVHGHLQPLLLVQKGDQVDRGTVMGFGGNSGSNAKDEKTGLYVYHYHIGTLEPNFKPTTESPGGRVVSPHIYAEKGGRLDTWNGNELDFQHNSEVAYSINYTNYLIDRLPKDVLGDINRNTYIGTKLGFLLDLLKRGIFQQHIKHDPTKVENDLKRFMGLRPTYTLFVNPKRLDLYRVIIH